MDEPLSALDPDTRSQMQDLIREFHEQIKGAIILVTHDPKEAYRLGDEVLEMTPAAPGSGQGVTIKKAGV
jgi:ABC-type proline/glycine betaine transport system ATPase subunit